MKAKRGDVAILVTECRTYVIGQPSETRTAVNVFEVTSVTRDGLVKAVRSAWANSAPTMLARMVPATVHLISKDTISAADALRVAAEHHWPGHPGQPMAFDSLDAVREALRPLVKVSA